MIDLYNDTTGELIGQITDADLQVLVDALEEESTEDRDYFISHRSYFCLHIRYWKIRE